MKTIKQIADELGVSKQAVYKRYKGRLKEQLLPHAHTVDGVVYIEEQGETLIKSDFNKKEAHTGVHTEPHTNNTLYVILQAELESKNRQIESLIEQNSALIAQLDTSQRLHAGTIQQQLTNPSDEQLATDEIEAETPDTTKSLTEPNKKFYFDEIITISGEKGSDFQKNTQKKEKRGFFGLFSRKS